MSISYKILSQTNSPNFLSNILCIIFSKNGYWLRLVSSFSPSNRSSPTCACLPLWKVLTLSYLRYCGSISSWVEALGSNCPRSLSGFSILLWRRQSLFCCESMTDLKTTWNRKREPSGLLTRPSYFPAKSSEQHWRWTRFSCRCCCC